MRTYEEIDRIMQTIPEQHRKFCNAGARGEECGCSGCVLVPAIYLKINMNPRDHVTREEFDMWKRRQPPTEAEANQAAFEADRDYLRRVYGDCVAAYKNGRRLAIGLTIQSLDNLVRPHYPVTFFSVSKEENTP